MAMISLRSIRDISYVTTVRANLLWNSSKSAHSVCRTKPIELIIRRNASIRTRNIIVQNLKLEHVSNWGIALITFPISCFALGVWQIKRKVWKENFIAEMKRLMDQEPSELPEDITHLKDMEYRAVKMRGEFLHDKELYIGPRSLIEPEGKGQGRGAFGSRPNSGYLVVSPFKLEGRNEIVLVNRGWIPMNCLKPETRQSGQAKGVVEITAVVRKNENRPQFMPKSKGEILLYRDLNRMCSLTGADPYLFDATHETTIPGGPVGGQTTISIRNEHLSYIFTWFSLAGISSYFWYKMVCLAPK